MKIKNKLLLSALTVFGLVFFLHSCQEEYTQPNDADSEFYGIRTGVAITAIVLDAFPEQDSSFNAWDVADTSDLGGRPDIYYRLYDSPDTNNYAAYTVPFQFENVNQDSLPIVYYLTNPYQVRAFGSDVLFNIYDFEKNDTTATIDSTLMQSFIFSISPKDSLMENPYPAFVTVEGNGYAARFYLNWIK